MPTLWVDADAAPREVKEILYRAAERTGLPLVLVANKPLRTPPSQLIRSVIVPGGPDVADAHIVEQMASGDLVVTADIPLAADAVAKGGVVLNPRGEEYSDANMGERLAMRDFMTSLRETGEITGGPRGYSLKDKQRFANALDRVLARMAAR